MTERKGVAVVAEPEELTLLAYLTAIQQYVKLVSESTSRTTKGTLPEDDEEGKALDAD